jgi:hypothetical protein
VKLLHVNIRILSVRMFTHMNCEAQNLNRQWQNPQIVGGFYASIFSTRFYPFEKFQSIE